MNCVLIVKATRVCNLRCSYCHDWRTGPGQAMSFPVLAHMTAAALRDGAYGSVSFIWHGGEPLLLRPDFYTKALLLQAHIRCAGQRITNCIQTNATLLDPAWARFLRANDIRVSVSLDGPPEIHDRHRVLASGRPSFDRVLRGLDVLREHAVPFSVLMVIDEEALALGARAIFDFFLKHGIQSYGLLAAAPENQPDAEPGTPTTHYVEPARMTAFLCQMYDRWREHGDLGIRIRELDAIRARVVGQAAGACTLAGGCFGHYFAVEPNGDIAHCDLFVGDGRYTLGNVLEPGSFAQLAAGAALDALEAESQSALRAMQACPEFAACNGWCPHERYLAVRHDPNHTAGCCGLRPLARSPQLLRLGAPVMGALPPLPDSGGSLRSQGRSRPPSAPRGSPIERGNLSSSARRWRCRASPHVGR